MFIRGRHRSPDLLSSGSSSPEYMMVFTAVALLLLPFSDLFLFLPLYYRQAFFEDCPSRFFRLLHRFLPPLVTFAHLLPALWRRSVAKEMKKPLDLALRFTPAWLSLRPCHCQPPLSRQRWLAPGRLFISPL